MKYTLFYTAKAKKNLKDIDTVEANRILDKLDFFIETGKPFKYAKKLREYKNGSFRFRIGDYRVIFDVDNKGNITLLVILLVKHRRDVYL
jgi:mRNA interferase RelE/StbE